MIKNKRQEIERIIKNNNNIAFILGMGFIISIMIVILPGKVYYSLYGLNILMNR